MSPQTPLSPARYRATLILGLVLSIAMIGIGIWGVVASNEPVLGWLMLVAGVAITVLSMVQLRRD